MKRYRTLAVDFDTRANILNFEIKPEWEESVKQQHAQNKVSVMDGLVAEFGVHNKELKIQNFIEIGPAPFSILAFHNRFMRQIRYSFVIGGYYPALTGATTLTERILNHLILALREDFKHTPEYKDVYKNKSFTNWDDLIKVLVAWNVLLPETLVHLKKLQTLRHQFAAHFNPLTDTDDRRLALEAVVEIQGFINIQFGFYGLQPWFIPGTKGAFFLKKEFESQPFIKKVYLPNCVLVGPRYKFGDDWGVIDDDYENREISDEEFAALLPQ